MEKLICKRCWHSWMPRVEDVKECPKCKSRLWSKTKQQENSLKSLENKEQEKPLEPLASILGAIFRGLENKNENII